VTEAVADLLVPLGILATLAVVVGPAAHRTRIEVQEQAERRPVTPSPDDV
jgi:hypothetical protein